MPRSPGHLLLRGLWAGGEEGFEARVPSQQICVGAQLPREHLLLPRIAGYGFCGGAHSSYWR